MTATETDRLCDWLKAHGHTAEEALQCIKYIAGRSEPTSDPASTEKAHRNPDQETTVS
jgi:hypothetical protein